jgi:hypothetical protein
MNEASSAQAKLASLSLANQLALTHQLAVAIGFS